MTYYNQKYCACCRGFHPAADAQRLVQALLVDNPLHGPGTMADDLKQDPKFWELAAHVLLQQVQENQRRNRSRVRERLGETDEAQKSVPEADAQRRVQPTVPGSQSA